MNADGGKDAGSGSLAGTITKTVISITGGTTLNKAKDPKEDLIRNPNRQDNPKLNM